MGSPIAINETQYAELEKASELVAEPVAIRTRGGGAEILVNLPRQGVALVTID
jgi:xylan 1,4-beta-xylosidase